MFTIDTFLSPKSRLLCTQDLFTSPANSLIEKKATEFMLGDKKTKKGRETIHLKLNEPTLLYFPSLVKKKCV